MNDQLEQPIPGGDEARAPIGASALLGISLPPMAETSGKLCRARSGAHEALEADER